MPVRVGTSVSVAMHRFGLRNSHDESAMLHAFQSDQTASEFLYAPGFAMHNQNFQARIVIQMCVTGGDHKVVVRVLKFG
jgi:hypothetical protein